MKRLPGDHDAFGGNHGLVAVHTEGKQTGHVWHKKGCWVTSCIERGHLPLNRGSCRPLSQLTPAPITGNIWSEIENQAQARLGHKD